MNPGSQGNDDGPTGRGRGRATSRSKPVEVRVRDCSPASSTSSELSVETGSEASDSSSCHSGPQLGGGHGVRLGRGHGSGIDPPVTVPGTVKGRGRGKSMKKMSLTCSSSDVTSESETELSVSQLGPCLPSLPAREHDNILRPPQQRTLGYFPGPPTSGRPCSLATNNFKMEVKVPEGVLYMYDVTIIPPWSRLYRRSDKVLYQ